MADYHCLEYKTRGRKTLDPLTAKGYKLLQHIYKTVKIRISHQSSWRLV